MKTLLLVTHRPIDQTGGASARWKAFSRYLPEHGWRVEVVAAPAGIGAAEFDAAQSQVAARARVMAQVGRLADPMAAAAGVKPEAFPPSMAWIRRGSRAVRQRLGQADVVLATGPPVVALLAARAGVRDAQVPFVAELRDLWAGSPAFDRRGGLLTSIERWVFGRANAIVVMSPEAQADVAGRHPDAAGRIHVIPNGFDPELLADAAAGGAISRATADSSRIASKSRRGSRITLIHSGTLTAGRPPQPLVRVLSRDPYRSRFRLVLHGYVTPDVASELGRVDREIVESVPPSEWRDAVARIAAADAGVVLQGDAVGDATAVASKVFEYLALGKPVLCVTDGGATEALLRRLGADQLAARLDDDASIARALDRLASEPPPVPAGDQLAEYDRSRLAGDMAALLDELAASPGK